MLQPQKGGNMERTKLLTVLIVISLIIAGLNLYATINLYIGIRTVAKNLVAAQKQNRLFPSANMPNRPPRPPSPTERVKVAIGNSVVKGDEKAPVTLMEFSDYQCPFSGRFFKDSLPQIEQKYIKTGKVKMAFRDYPLGFHQKAQKAAEATKCAKEQGKFWQYHDKLFANQQKLETADLKKYAKELGLDSKKFDTCLDSGKTAAEVKKDFEDGTKYGVMGTPCFFINGLKIDGAMPYETFEEVIEKELKKK